MAKVRLNANSVWPSDNYNSITLQDFAKRVAAKTNGEVEIVVHAGGALGYKGPELLGAVKDGVVPISDMLTSGVAASEPLCNIVTLPFLVRGFDEGRTLAEISRPYFDKTLGTKWNQKILYITPWPPAGLWTKREIKNVADMKGLKTRTYDENGARFMKAVGATPYALPFSEVRSSLVAGVIDSVLTSTPTAVDAKFWEVLNYFHRIDVTMATDLVTINMDVFKKLDPKLQQAILDAGRETEESIWKKVAELDKSMEAVCNKNGIKSVPVSKEMMDQLFAITENIRQDWLKQAPPEAREIVGKFLKAVGR